MQYNRILIKLSGEALSGSDALGINEKQVDFFANELLQIHKKGIQIVVVIGGGNFFRGAQMPHMDRCVADSLGMLATVMNGIVLKSALEKIGISTLVMSALPVPAICPSFDRRVALHHLQESHIVISVGGIGNPFFTTDTCATLRAIELKCDILLKATQVDGVYDRDPKQDQNAERFDTITYDQILSRGLKIMDGTAISLARDHKIPISVFSRMIPGNILNVLMRQGKFTQIQE